MMLMQEDFATVRRRISRKFLGRGGIHGIGIHPSIAGAIAVYRDPSVGPASDRVIADLKNEVGPFKCEVIEADAAVVSDGAPEIADPRNTDGETATDGRPVKEP
jgi:hypothetical protein